MAAAALLLALPTLSNAQDIYLANGGGADLTWKGTAAGARAGVWMDIGAVSTDTRRDLVVGAPGTGSMSGTVYLIFGGPDRTGDLSLSTADAVISSGEAGNRFGAATAVGNILNTEGSTPRNLLVGAPGAAGGRGAVYLFSAGYSNGARTTEASATLRILGASGDALGTALATADLDNDGYREIIMGAPGNSRVYIVRGGPSLSGTIDLSSTPAAVTLVAAGIGSVLLGGDITGDGIYDLLVGSPSTDVVFGYVGTNGTIPSVPAISFGAEKAGDEAGASIRILDIDDDGRNDLVIGAPGGDGPGGGRPNAGNVYVFLGPVAAGGHNVAEAQIVFYGAGANYRAGDRVAIGDINRDTFNDIVIGASGGSGGAGELDIYYGRGRSNIGSLQPNGQRIVDMSVAGQVNRHVFGDPASGSIGAVQVFEVTGEGARDIIVSVPALESNTGKLYFTISPKLRISPTTVSLVASQGTTAVSPSPIAVKNPSIVVTGWETSTTAPWLSASPASGSIDQAHSGSFYLVASTAGLTPGTYTAKMNVSSTSPDLIMTLPVNVSLTVTGTRITVDSPTEGATVSNGLVISGWAIDLAAGSGTGVSQVQAYAYRSSGAPLFLGVASYGAARPDVGAAYGPQFANSGYSLTVRNLTPGASYHIVVFAKSTFSNTLIPSTPINVVVASSSAAPGPTPTDPNPAPPPDPAAPSPVPTPNPNTRVSVNRTGLFFGAANGGAIHTGAQTATVSFTNGGSTWTVASDQSWVTVSPSSGSGAGSFNVTVNPGSRKAGTTLNATLTINAAGVANSPLTLPVQLTVYGAPAPPGGFVETPADGVQGVTGSIAVTGWAIDDLGVTEVTIWRDPMPGETASASNGKVFIGRAVQVEGARPDVDAGYSLPWDYKAGWGYLLLTNMLPNQGNGAFRLHAYASDVEGNSVLIGSRTIVCDNAHATKPFGAIDTPDQGGTASGTAFVNFGWALTPQPSAISTNGSTITVFIDGVPVGHPVYNQNRPDVQSLFPGLKNTNGAIGYFQFDTTTLANGVHTIAWGVSDDHGNTEGIGSRYFTVLNGSSASFLSSATAVGATVAQMIQTEPAHQAATAAGVSVGQPAATLSSMPVAPVPSYVQAGFSRNAPLEIVEPTGTEPPTVSTTELGLVRVAVGAPVDGPDDEFEGYLVKGDHLEALPVGSMLDSKSGEFYWQPGVGFVGSYEFVFLRKANGVRERIPLRIQITPSAGKAATR